MTVWQKFDRWMFGYGSPVTLGALRAVFGALALLSLLLQAPDWRAWYSETGLVPVSAAQAWSGQTPRLNLLYHVTDPNLTLAFFLITLLAAITTMVGLGTRVSTIVLAVGLVTLNHRNPFILNSGDTLLRVTAITLAVAPAGAALSLDRWLKLRKGKPVQDEVSLWPQRIVAIQMAVLYFTTVWHKVNGVHWLDGTAAWYPPHLTEFDRFPVPAFVDQPPFLQAATWGTLVIELALATLVFWRPVRKWVLLGGVGLHAAIEYRFNIPLFAFLSIAQYLAHYDGEEVQAWINRVQNRLRRPTPETA